MYSTSARSGHERLICSETLWPLASGRTFNTTSAWRLRCAENAVTSPHHSTHVNMNCEQFAAFKLFKLFSPQRFLEDVHWYDVSRNGSRRFCLLLTLNFAAMALALARDWTCDCDIDYFPFCPALKTCIHHVSALPAISRPSFSVTCSVLSPTVLISGVGKPPLTPHT